MAFNGLANSPGPTTIYIRGICTASTVSDLNCLLFCIKVLPQAHSTDTLSQRCRCNSNTVHLAKISTFRVVGYMCPLTLYLNSFASRSPLYSCVQITAYLAISTFVLKSSISCGPILYYQAQYERWGERRTKRDWRDLRPLTGKISS